MTDLNYSEAESRRFDKLIFRGKIDVLEIDALKEFYANNDPDIVIFRIPVSEQDKLYQLNTLNKDIIFADTLVYYEVDLVKSPRKPLKNQDIIIRNIDYTQKQEFEDLIPKIFKNYPNHYYSNPLLDKTKIGEGYMEWAVNSFNTPGALHLMAYDKDMVPISFMTYKINTPGVEAEITLSGMVPQYQGIGLHNDMLRFVREQFIADGIPRLIQSTQIRNFHVQRAWSKDDFILFQAYCTIHMNKR
jgi:hypothetical protein